MITKKIVFTLIALVLYIPVIALAQQTGGVPALREELQAVKTDLQTQINTLQNQIKSIPAGPQGPAGPAGPQGPAGANVAAGQQCPEANVVVGFDQNGNIICVPRLYEIGDSGPAGGIVFYVDASGLHGLEAAPADQSSEVPWGCYGKHIYGADGLAVGTGAQNTADILAGCTESPIAAEIAHTYSLNGYTDWFLPSRDELNLLYLQKLVVGGFATGGRYWSSTEYGSDEAWYQNFGDGRQDYVNGKGSPWRVRAVRAF